MPLTFDAWLGVTDEMIGTPSDREAERAAIAWRKIQEKPTSVTFIKPEPDNTILDPQTVRLEYDNSASEAESAAGEGAVRQLVIFGIQGHNDLADTDVAEKYRFVAENQEYTVVDVIDSIGERQAVAEAVG